LFLDEEYVYVSTDERPDVFKSDFVPTWEKAHFKVLSFANYAHLVPSDMDPKWVPLIETIICSCGRIFVGTHFSTFTSYAHRLRGHMHVNIVKDKSIYFTELKYQTPKDHQTIGYLSWDREFPRSWLVDDEANGVPSDFGKYKPD